MKKPILIVVFSLLAVIVPAQSIKKDVKAFNAIRGKVVKITGSDTLFHKRTIEDRSNDLFYEYYNNTQLRVTNVNRQDLFKAVNGVEGYLNQIYEGYYSYSQYSNQVDFDRAISNLNVVQKAYKIEINTLYYQKEFAYYLKYPVKSQEEIKQERIKMILREQDSLKQVDIDNKLRIRTEQLKQDSIRRAAYLIKKREKEREDSIVSMRWYEAEQEEIRERDKQIEARNKQVQANAAQKKQEAEARKNSLIKQYGSVTANKILEHKVEIGWTKEMCIESWGKPKKIHTTETATNKHEQYIYSTSRYLYFDNGILTASQY